MTSTINASTTAGIVTTADTSGVLALQTAGTTAVTVDASQRVGIGTASPTQLLTLSNGATPRISLKDTRASVEMQVLADNVAGYSGTVTSDPYIFVTNNAERARFNAGAPILCLSGGSTTATGTGIAFPATQSASTDANTLDDYEEGTWTPTIASSGGTITSYSIGSGSARYTKIGRVVALDFTVSIINAGTASGVMTITGLPFNLAGSNLAAGVMSENQSVGLSGSLVALNTTVLYAKKYDGGNPVTASLTWVCQITYEI